MLTYTAVATPSTAEGSQWRSVTVVAARLVEVDGTVHYIGRWPDPTEDAA